MSRRPLLLPLCLAFCAGGMAQTGAEAGKLLGLFPVTSRLEMRDYASGRILSFVAEDGTLLPSNPDLPSSLLRGALPRELFDEENAWDMWFRAGCRVERERYVAVFLDRECDELDVRKWRVPYSATTVVTCTHEGRVIDWADLQICSEGWDVQAWVNARLDSFAVRYRPCGSDRPLAANRFRIMPDGTIRRHVAFRFPHVWRPSPQCVGSPDTWAFPEEMAAFWKKSPARLKADGCPYGHGWARFSPDSRVIPDAPGHRMLHNVDYVYGICSSASLRQADIAFLAMSSSSEPDSALAGCDLFAFSYSKAGVPLDWAFLGGTDSLPPHAVTLRVARGQVRLDIGHGAEKRSVTLQVRLDGTFSPARRGVSP